MGYLQMNQIAAICQWASLTIVACDGESAAQGLPGISHARDMQLKSLKFDDFFAIVRATPSLDYCLRKSKWQTRGWTYQEYTTSRRLLFFRKYGLYIRVAVGSGKSTHTYAENAEQNA
jgi:hypothetical protein